MMGTAILSMPWAFERVCESCVKFSNRFRLYRDESVVSRPTQPSTLCGMGNEYRSKCGDALWLWSKGRMIHSIRG